MDEGDDEVIPRLQLIPLVDPAAGAAPELEDAGAVRNTLQQFAAQIAGLVFTGGLGLYLVRALGPSRFGIYSLAVGIGTLVLYPVGLGLPYGIGRFLADHRGDLGQLRAIFRLGLRLQIVAAAAGTIVLIVISHPLADAFGKPALTWPLRWIALSIAGQAGYTYLASVVSSLRQSRTVFWMALLESATEATASVALVVAGAGAAGAVLGKTLGYSVALGLGLAMTYRLLGFRSGAPTPALVLRVTEIVRYSGAMLIVDVVWSAIGQLDVLLIGLLLSAGAVGAFSAVFRILTLLAYPAVAVAGGVAPRLSRVDGEPDVHAFVAAVRLLILIEGAALAPMIVWAHPITRLLFGPGYHRSAEILAVLSVQAFVGSPNALLSLAVTYLGEARLRVKIVTGTLVLGLVATYVLVRTVGVVGAAIADDFIQVVYLITHLVIASRLLNLSFRPLARTVLRALAAAGLMAVPLVLAGYHHLSVAGWLIGGFAGLVVYVGVLVGTRELSAADLASLRQRLPLASVSGRRS